jgi:fatty acid desaturase
MGVRSILDLSLKGVNFVFFVIVLGLTGSLISGQDGSSSRVNFALFAAVWGIVISSLYGFLSNFVEALAWPLLVFIFEFLTLVFTFAAATALAVGLRVHSCTNQSYLDSNNITQGSTDRCRKGQASTAFLYFAFFVTLFSFAAAVYSLISGGAFGSKRKSRGGVPTISTA